MVDHHVQDIECNPGHEGMISESIYHSICLRYGMAGGCVSFECNPCRKQVNGNSLGSVQAQDSDRIHNRHALHCEPQRAREFPVGHHAPLYIPVGSLAESGSGRE
jgi:hypothetical protein